MSNSNKNVKIDIDIKDLFTEQREFLTKNRDEENTWRKVRNDENFTLIEREFDWGKRKIYLPIELKNNYLLQRSRGIDLELEDTDQIMIEKIERSINDMTEIDLIRINEIDAVKKHYNIPDFKNFCELGFRIPKLQNYYKQIGLSDVGLDINDYNVKLSNKLGFNCKTFDLSKDDCSELNFKDNELIVCYHVLEHLSDPFEGLSKIVEASKKGTFYHFEVPIEPDGPRLWYGHLYPFHPLDLQKMFQKLNCRILYASNQTSKNPQGPWIERYSAIKE